MPTRALDRVVRHLRRAALPPGEGEGTDGELVKTAALVDGR